MTTHLREKYVNPYTDFGFKKLFGTEMNKELLISFINSLLKGEEEIRDLTYLNTEHLGMREADRKAVFEAFIILPFPYANKERKGNGTMN